MQQTPIHAAIPPGVRVRRSGKVGRRTTASILAGALGVAGFVAIGTGAAHAAVPDFPDNIAVFPDRDFVSVEGFTDHAGQTATLEVTRGGVLVGSTQSVISGEDVAFEANHPGGVCWGVGAGSALQVTPDIRGGDVVTLKIGQTAIADTTVSTATVTADSSLSGTTLTVVGTYGPDVNPDFMEQRIINPDLVPTPVNRRDIRAVPGPMTPAPKGGYSSQLVVGDGHFTATYLFDDAATAQIAHDADLGERAMSWQVQDSAGNRQGLTISEFGEAGGPGMGGCPLGPGDATAPAGMYSAVRSADKTKLVVSWTPADPVPGAAAVTAFNVDAIAPTSPAAPTFGPLVGARVGATADKVTLAVDPAVPSYTVEVRALAGGRMGDVFAPASSGPADGTAPTLAASPASGQTNQVTLSSEAGADVYYTTDGSSPLDGDLPSLTSVLYKSPIAIKTANTVVRAVAFDRAGNISSEFTGTFSPVVTPPPPAAPQGLIAKAGLSSVQLDWSPVAGATSYQVTVSGGPIGAQPPSTTSPSQKVTGLTGGTTYRFSVTATGPGGTGPRSAEVTSIPERGTIKLSIVRGTWKNADMRIVGSVDAAPTVGTVRFYRVAADGKSANLSQPVGGTAPQPLTAAVAPATGSDFDARYRTTALTGTTSPGTIVAVLSDSAGTLLGTSPAFTLKS